MDNNIHRYLVLIQNGICQLFIVINHCIDLEYNIVFYVSADAFTTNRTYYYWSVKKNVIHFYLSDCPLKGVQFEIKNKSDNFINL